MQTLQQLPQSMDPDETSGDLNRNDPKQISNESQHHHLASTIESDHPLTNFAVLHEYQFLNSLLVLNLVDIFLEEAYADRQQHYVV